MSDVVRAVGVVYHAVDLDLFTHVHRKEEREPAGAEVGTRLDPAKTKTTLFTNIVIGTKHNKCTYSQNFSTSEEKS